MQFITQYMNIDGFCLCWYERLPSGSICFSCFTWSHLSLQVRAFVCCFPSAEGVWSNPRQTGPDLHAQVEVKLLLYSVDSKGKRHKGLKMVLTRSVYQHPTNMAVLFHTLSSSLMLCPSRDNPLPAQVPRKTDWDFFCTPPTHFYN